VAWFGLRAEVHALSVETPLMEQANTCRMSDDQALLGSNTSHAIGGVAQWVPRLTRNLEVVGLSPVQGIRCFLEQETLLIAKYWLVPGTDSSVISQSN